MPKESLLASMPKLILAVVLIVCVGAVIGLMGWALTKKQTRIEALKIKTPNKIIKDETNDWQTYQNEKYGYFFEYPSDCFYGSMPRYCKQKPPEEQPLECLCFLDGEDQDEVFLITFTNNLNIVRQSML